ncbi:phage holin family protein [Nonomuraea sp. NPDC050310]|uniref:phage holin family protein n=1 Tax=unclassified Nonomuraea TaxID=2593643 RepID=UPI0033DA951E
MSTPGPQPSPSLGDLVGDLGSDLSKLFRQEVELAKTEIREEAAKAGKAAGMLGGAGVAGWMTALFASLALVWGLDAAIDAGWAALIVTLLWGAVAAALFVTGRKKLQTVSPVPEKTVQTLKEDAAWARDLKS